MHRPLDLLIFGATGRYKMLFIGETASGQTLIPCAQPGWIFLVVKAA